MIDNKSLNWLEYATSKNYTHNFNWLGLKVIQYPQDLNATQELIYKIKPDVIIECGIAHGGSLIFYSSILSLINLSSKKKSFVIGIDKEIRLKNLNKINNHSLSNNIKLIEGSSTSLSTIKKVENLIKKHKKIIVFLDSNHTHNHVLKGLKIYSKYVNKDSYIVVFDTLIEDIDDKFHDNRAWSQLKNPKTAVYEFLKNNKKFKIDKKIYKKLLISNCPDGYLKKVK